MLGRPMLRVNSSNQAAQAGYRPLGLFRAYLETTAASMTLTAAHIAAGWVVRSGQAGAIADTLPSVDSLLAAFPELTRGDTFTWSLTSSTANANAIVAGAGMTLAGTTSAAASSTRDYLFTLTSEPKRTSVAPGSTTNGSAILTNLGVAALSAIGVGMGVTGTNVPASTTIIAVNLSAGTATMSANATGTADNTAFTFTPQMEVRGIRTAGI